MKFESNTNCMFETKPGYNILHNLPILNVIDYAKRRFFNPSSLVPLDLIPN